MALSKHTRTRLITVNGKKVRAHRHIMEQHLGRKLSPNEDVHHENKNPLDNQIGNLKVMERPVHIDHHAKEKQIYPDFKNCAHCGGRFKVNPRRRKRQKCCSKDCAQAMRVEGTRRRWASFKYQITA